jgi:hypothetical protein
MIAAALAAAPLTVALEREEARAGVREVRVRAVVIGATTGAKHIYSGAVADTWQRERGREQGGAEAC